MASAALPGTVNVFGNQPVVLQQAVVRRGFTETDARVVTQLGVLQLAAGIFSIIFQAAVTGMDKNIQDTSKPVTIEILSCGIWCGVMFMIAGILGVFSGKQNKTRLIVTFLVFNIVISVMVWILLGFAAGNLAIIETNCPYREKVLSTIGSRAMVEYTNSNFNSYYSHYYSYSVYRAVYYTDYYTTYERDCSFRDRTAGKVWKAMDSLLLILAIFEFAIAVASAAYCCRALPCSSVHRTPVFVSQQNVGPAGAYLYGPSMQPIFLQQGSSIQGPVFVNPMMIGSPAGYSVGASSVQLYPQVVPEAASSDPRTGASTSSGQCTWATPTAPTEQNVYANDPNAPPNYYEITN